MESIKIGLVDDHNLFREGIKALLLSTKNIEMVLEAVSGKDLLIQLKTTVPDLVLLDLDMEDMNGIEVTKVISQDYPNVKIIILTMHKEERMIAYMMEIGAHGYLLKDTNQAELTEAIEKVYHNGFYFNPRIASAMLKGLKDKSKNEPELGNSFQLTKREIEVLHLIAEELTTTEMAEKMFLSERTIEGYRKNLIMKMGVKNAAGLVLKAIKHGLLTP
jgi:DNA-binding NarL/FixJ family response regulator